MVFNSIDFGIFFPLVFILYWTFFKKNIQYRNVFLISVSYFFYGWWDWRFLSLIIISSLIDFIIGKKIYNEENSIKRKRWLITSIAVNIGFLGFFKYYNFFTYSFIDAFSFFGIQLNGYLLSIILPVGISFYTFQTLSYTLDIYYKKFKPTNNIFAFFAFVAFFPQLVAGPIERAKDLLPQFLTITPINYDLLRSGLLLMVWGFFKKIVIADRLAIFVDGAYGDLDCLDGITSIVGIIFFTFQVYLDFSAYSDIAIGSARLLGFNLSINFRRPYLSSSFSDFWKRWHISLSSWFKDYVYIPLGGNRTNENKIKRNILIVFVLSGLWHGASWNFVIWGVLNALFLLVFDKYFSNKKNKLFKKVFISFLITSLWALSLIFFRTQTLEDALKMFANIFEVNQGILYDYGLNAIEFSFTIILLIVYVVFEIIIEKYDNLYEWFCKCNFVIRWATYISILLFMLLFGSYGVGLNDSVFIYFQF